MTWLMAASMFNSTASVKELLDRGADVDEKANFVVRGETKSLTAEEIAVALKHHETILLFRPEDSRLNQV